MMSYSRIRPGLPLGPVAPTALLLMFERPRNRAIRRCTDLPYQTALDAWEDDGGSVAAAAAPVAGVEGTH